jgi:hypothetical protein
LKCRTGEARSRDKDTPVTGIGVQSAEQVANFGSADGVAPPLALDDEPVPGRGTSDDIDTAVTATTDAVDLVEAFLYKQSFDKDFELVTGHPINLFEAGVVSDPFLPPRLDHPVPECQNTCHAGDKHDRDTEGLEPMGDDDINEPSDAHDDYNQRDEP